MAQKKYDAAVKTGEYTDRNGETKGRWLNVGAVLQTDNGHVLLLDRTFNPAGIADPQERGTVMVSLFPPRDKEPSAQPASGPRQASQNLQSPREPGMDDNLDSDIPF